jgi:hypothetical protein
MPMVAQRDIRGASMGAHRFVSLGAWGSKQTTIAAARCAKCGFMYVAMNFAGEPEGQAIAIGEDGENLEPAALDEGCPVEG